MNDISNDDLEAALSHLSVIELNALDRFIDSSPLSSSLQKREITQEQDNDMSDEVSKRWNCPRNGVSTREDPVNFRLNDEQRAGILFTFYFKGSTEFSNFFFSFTDSRFDKREVMAPNLSFRRNRSPQRLTPDQRIEAKINFLRDKYKRQSASN